MIDTLFFIASKLIGVLLQPDTWIVIALAFVLLALVKQKTQFALWIVGAMFLSLLTLSIFPLGNLLLQPIEQRYPANPPLTQVAGIIVLGGGENARASVYWDQIQLNEGGDRFTQSLALARRFPKAKLLYAGGSGALRDLTDIAVSEASIAERFFMNQGIKPERLMLEGKSRNTSENARLTLALAKPNSGETWVLVTSAFHAPRAMRSFKAAGWINLVAWPVDYRTSRFVDDIGWRLISNLHNLKIAIREWVGQFAYQLTGR